MKELHKLSAVEIGRRVNSGELRPVEILDYFFKRIDEYNPTFNAFVYLKKEEAYEAARVLEDRLKAGENVGPFAGVPFALKDFLPSKEGWTNSLGGVKISVDPYSSEFCKAMEKAGGIAIGKTNAPAYGFRGTTDNLMYGPTKNPYNPEFNAGGSSGGSAAAVALGMVPIAEGGDAGGSIRVPAAWCGCYGFKASFGLIPNVCRPDAWSATHPFCTPGGLTKTVEDATVLLGLMAQYNPRDPMSQCGKIEFGKPNKLWKVAVTLDFGIFGNVDIEILSALLKAATVLKKAGAQVDLVSKVFDFQWSIEDLANLWYKNLAFDTAVELFQPTELGAPDLTNVPAEVEYWCRESLKMTPWDTLEFNKARTGLLDGFENVFEKYDIILAPVTTCLPVRNSEERGETREPINFAETFIVNFTGYPAASCPAGFSESGLPIGVQVIGPRYKDDRVLAVSQILENNFNNNNA